MNTTYSKIRQYYFIIIGISLGSLYWIVDSYLDALRSGNTLSMELYHTDMHMLYEWFLVLLLFIVFSVYAIYKIAKLKLMEEELQRTIILLREEKAKTESIIASIGNPISIQDTNFKILYQNKISQKIMGDQKGKYCYEYEHRDHICEGCPVNMSFNDGRIHTMEKWIIKDGQKLYFENTASPLRDSSGNIIAGIEVVRDITESKKAELEYKTILKTAMDGFYVIDLQGHILDVNDSYCSLIGYNRDELLNLTIKDIDAIDTEEIIAQRIARIAKVGWDRFETSHKCKDGRIVNIEASINYMGIEGGRLYVFMRDITEHRKAEGILLENERLLYMNKIKNEFIANMNHELRTPLTSVIGFSQLLKRRTNGELNEKQELYVDNVIESSKFLLHLINDILDLSKIEAHKMDLVIENMSVEEVINETFMILKELAVNHNIIMVKNIEPQLDFIMADKQRFKQVLFNLLSNAVKFSKEDGGIVTLSARKSGDMVQFSVSDTGIGIKEEDLGKLFRKFEQLDSGYARKSKGTGLGLAISKQLVELHGGNIMVESKIGEGSTFTFFIPIISITTETSPYVQKCK